MDLLRREPIPGDVPVLQDPPPLEMHQAADCCLLFLHGMRLQTI